MTTNNERNTNVSRKKVVNLYDVTKHPSHTAQLPEEQKHSEALDL